MLQLSKVSHSNFASQFATFKGILRYFYKSLTNETYVVEEKSCHNGDYKPNIYLA
jgi:hypothetical protein